MTFGFKRINLWGRKIDEIRRAGELTADRREAG